jgi:hypothetical protein
MECVRSEPTEKGGNTAHVSSHAASADFKKGLSSTPLAHFASWVHVVNSILDVVMNRTTVAVPNAPDTSHLFAIALF